MMSFFIQLLTHEAASRVAFLHTFTPLIKRADAEWWNGKAGWSGGRGGECSDVGANLLLIAAQEADSLSCQIRPKCIKKEKERGSRSD